MKKYIMYALLFAISLSFYAVGKADDKEASPDDTPNSSISEVKKELQDAFSEMISSSVTVFSGMAAGMQEGAEKAQAELDGADGTKLIANKKDLAELVQVSVFKVENQENGGCRVTLAVKNSNDFPVRLVNLTRKQAALLLDVDGFAHEQTLKEGQARTVTVASRAAVKVTFTFAGLEARPGVFRLFDMDFPVDQ